MPKSLNLPFLFLLLSSAIQVDVVVAAQKKCGLHCGDGSVKLPEPKTLQQQIDSMFKVVLQGNTVLPPPACPTDMEVSTDPDAAMGARLAMAQIYGSCDVLKLPVLENCNIKKISPDLKFTAISEGNRYPRKGVSKSQLPLLRDTHPYLQGFKSSECFTLSKCEEMKQTKELDADVCKKASCDPILEPPTYQYGGKGNGKSSVYQHRSGNGYQYNGLDCSAFVSAALGMRGLRYFPGEDNTGMGFGTAGYAQLGKKDANGNSMDCFDEPINVTGMQAGDLLVAPNNHIVLVDTVGDDPFGINGILSKAKLVKSDAAEAGSFDQLSSDSCKKRNAATKSSKKSSKTQPKLNCSIKPIQQLLDTNVVMDQALRMKQLNQVAESICLINVDKDDFQMTIMHSTSASNQTGVQRQHVKNGTFSPLSTLLEMKGRRDCIEELREVFAESVPELSAVKSAVVKAYEAKATTNGATKILRHDPRAECVGKPMPLQSRSCSACCNVKATYQDLMRTEGDVK